jgi:hypothetical protein
MLVGIFHQETYLWARRLLLQMTTLLGLHLEILLLDSTKLMKLGSTKYMKEP